MRTNLYRAYRIVSEQGLRELFRAARRFIKNKLKYRYKYLQRQYHQFSHDTQILNPYKLIKINPQDVEHLITPKFGSELPSDGSFLVGGDWYQPEDVTLIFYNQYEEKFNNRTCIPLENYVFNTSIEEHLQEGVPWNETEFYQWVTSTTKLPERSLYAQEDGREWRFSQIDRLAASISQNGYLTQAECGENPSVPSRDEYIENSISSTLPPEHHEVMINIGPNGELYFEEGRHRFAVARALGVDEIPVRVFVRHPKWQDKRSQLLRRNANDVREGLYQYLTHPDITALLKMEDSEGILP